MNKILVIDTSTEACSVALQLDKKIYQEYKIAPRQHGELVLPMVDSVLKQANIKLEELDCIGYGQGPGAFTGLRICVSIVQGLAFGANVPVVGVSSLQAMAQQTYLKEGAVNVLSAIDARMGEVYWGQYQNTNGLMSLVNEEKVCLPEDVTVLDVTSDEAQSSIIKNDADQENFYATGSGWETYSLELTSRIEQAITIESEVRFPRASAMIPFVEAQVAAGLAKAAEMAQPVYLRNNVAKKKGDQAKDK